MIYWLNIIIHVSLFNINIIFLFKIFFYNDYIMSDSEDYDITPANHACSSVTHSQVIKPTPNSSTGNATNDIDTTTNQHDADAQYDNTDNIEVKPLYGGGLIKFKIIFKNKINYVYSDNEINAIKKLFNNKIFKVDNLLEIFHNNKKSMYIIQKNYKNKFKKIH